MADFAQQRLNMVESQVRPSDVTDRRIMRAMLEVPRERFVPTALKPLAYMDRQIGLTKSATEGEPRGLLEPRVLAKLIQLADIESGDVVLDVGCGPGYSAALLAKLAETVVALEVDEEFAETATQVLADLGFDNVAVVTGPLEFGYADEGPYDAIFIGGRIDEIPAGLVDQLKDGGRLVAVRGTSVHARAVIWRRIGANFDVQESFEAAAPLLPGFVKAKTFAL
ncbi:MAG: protein-L-isoaspartate O-methyltransferase [Alphaproteobacteria bacterium]|nr:protein-L-isoaspartate O-methyltransferase [Alphaproteobacteria bacterium]